MLKLSGHAGLNCQWHHHVSPDEARALLHGAENRPWLNDFNFKPMAKLAELPDGKPSKRHVVQTIEFRWQVVAHLHPSGARGISGWQLRPTKAFA